MPIQATVILDSGCFLPMPEDNNPKATEIGYFQSSKSISDIRILADGNEVKYPKPINLGKKCKIEVRHVQADGILKQDGVKAAENFHEQLLHMIDLYGKDMPVDPNKFDCVLRFESGLFRGALVKPRYFREHKKQANGEFIDSPQDDPKLVEKPIMHNVFVLFKLKKGEAVELARDGQVFWSSKELDATDRIDIEIVADNTTTEKFYRMALKDKLESYWMPNWGDPPPVCSQPPCEP